MRALCTRRANAPKIRPSGQRADRGSAGVAAAGRADGVRCIDRDDADPEDHHCCRGDAGRPEHIRQGTESGESCCALDGRARVRCRVYLLEIRSHERVVVPPDHHDGFEHSRTEQKGNEGSAGNEEVVADSSGAAGGGAGFTRKPMRRQSARAQSSSSLTGNFLKARSTDFATYLSRLPPTSLFTSAR
jgi:hypothetical protein